MVKSLLNFMHTPNFNVYSINRFQNVTGWKISQNENGFQVK